MSVLGDFSIATNVINKVRHTTLIDLAAFDPLEPSRKPSLIATYTYDGSGVAPRPAKFRIGDWIVRADRVEALRQFVLTTALVGLETFEGAQGAAIILHSLFPAGYEPIYGNDGVVLRGMYTVQLEDLRGGAANTMTIPDLASIVKYFSREDAVRSGVLQLTFKRSW